MLAIHVLASGSKGNAAIVENLDNGEGVLIDCGICKRDFLSRCQICGFDAGKLKAILITHDHGDHVSKLGVVMRGLSNSDYALYALDEVIASCEQVSESGRYCEVRSISFDEVINIAGISITAFPTSHDASASCGFRFDSRDGDSIGYMTDTGYATQESVRALSGARIIALESNHDPDMLANGEYPQYLKRRISSDRGHLSNLQAADLLKSLLHDDLEHVLAMHLSEKNNLPSLAKESLMAVLDEVSHNAIVHIASQIRPLSVS